MLLVGLVAACSGGGDGPRPVTDEEAQRLAVARLSMYDADVVDLDLTVPVDGQTLHLVGRADMREHTGYAKVDDEALLSWTLADKAVLPWTGELPDQPPTDGWQTAAMDPSNPLDAALLTTLNLSSDRAENPLLLRQNGAQWVSSKDGVDVFTAPGPDDKPNPAIRYSVDDKGVLHRVEADTGHDEPLVIVLEPSSSTSVPALP